MKDFEFITMEEYCANMVCHPLSFTSKDASNLERLNRRLNEKAQKGWVRITNGDYPDELDRYERDEIHNGEMVFFLREIEEEKVKCDHMEIHGFTISGDGVETQKSKATSNFCKDCGEKLK